MRGWFVNEEFGLAEIFKFSIFRVNPKWSYQKVVYQSLINQNSFCVRSVEADMSNNLNFRAK
jgi:hypothetical protein